MKKKFTQKALCALLLCGVCLSVCCADKTQNDMSEQRFTVEEVSEAIPPYTPEEDIAATSKLLEAFCVAMYKSTGKNPTVMQKTEAKIMINGRILPIMKKHVTYSELEKLTEGEFEFTPVSLSQKYLEGAAIVGNERAGNISYDLMLLYYEQSRISAQNRYNKTGSADDAEKIQLYTRQYDDLKSKVDPAYFGTFFSMVTFFANAADSSGVTQGNVSADTPALMLTFVKRQSKLTEGLTDRQSLGVLARLSYELVFCDSSAPSGSDGTTKYMWEALSKNSNDIIKMGETLPELFALYSAIAEKITLEEIKGLYGGNLSALCKILPECRNEFFAWTESFEECLFESPEQYEAIVKGEELENYEEYKSQRTKISSAELYTMLCDEKSQNDDIKKAVENYLFGISPYVTYMIFSGTHISGGQNS